MVVASISLVDDVKQPSALAADELLCGFLSRAVSASRRRRRRMIMMMHRVIDCLLLLEGYSR
jgi:hypothetical protein